MATQPDIAPPDRIDPQSPPETPPASPPAETPFEEPPEIERNRAVAAGLPAAAAVAAASSSATSSAAPGTVLAGTCFVDRHLPAGDLLEVQVLNGVLGLLGVGHFDECETSRAAGSRPSFSW